MMYLNKNERKIIENFMAVESEYENENLLLKWDDGSQVAALYDSFIEDENDYEMEDEKYEEFWSFVFKKLEIIGDPPVEISEDNFFLINYHNFPDEIIVDGKKIN